MKVWYKECYFSNILIKCATNIPKRILHLYFHMGKTLIQLSKKYKGITRDTEITKLKHHLVDKRSEYYIDLNISVWKHIILILLFLILVLLWVIKHKKGWMLLFPIKIFAGTVPCQTNNFIFNEWIIMSPMI